jgi:membrane-associated phospholipid phosphatase
MARKVMTRSRRPAFSGAPPAYNRRMLWLTVIALVLALSVAPWDEQLSRQAMASPNVFLRFLAAYTDIGKSAAYLIAAFVIMTLLSLSDWRAHHVSMKARLALLYAQAAFAFGAIAGSGIVVNIFKFIFARARPKFLDQLGPYDFFGRMGVGYDFSSFPSGHSTTMGALSAILALWFPKLRFLTIPACATGAISRVAVGAHFPSDVVAGFALGFLFSLYLARHLARRHSVFRLSGGSLFPRLQFSGSFSR